MAHPGLRAHRDDGAAAVRGTLWDGLVPERAPVLVEELQPREVEAPAAVDAVRRVIEQHADEAERLRRMPVEAIDALRAAGLFSIWIPRSLGGLETPLPEALRTFEALGRIDGSAAWTVAIAAAGVMNYVSVAEDLFAEQFGGAEPGIAATGAFPIQPAQRVDGGYRVTARWEFASGCHHANRLAGGVIVMEDGKPVSSPDGSPVIRMLSFPRTHATIHDTWHVTGLRGTGSADIEVTDLFVPERESFSLMSEGSTNTHCQGPLYRLPTLVHGALPMAAVALGIAQQSMDAFVELAAGKRPALARTTLAEQPATHAVFGAAVARLRAGRAWLYEVATRTWAMSEAGETLDTAHRIDVQLASTYATQVAVEVVDDLQALAGTSAIREGSPIERCFRDIHTLKQNAGVSQRNLEYAGGTLLGHGKANRMVPS